MKKVIFSMAITLILLLSSCNLSDTGILESPDVTITPILTQPADIEEAASSTELIPSQTPSTHEDSTPEQMLPDNLELTIETFEKSGIIIEESGETNGSMASSRHYFQIFYGSWEITSFIPGGRFSKADDASCYIGSILELSEEKIKADDVIAISDPDYCCVLVKTEDCQYFWKYFYPDEPSDVINIDSPYFAYVYLNNVLDIRENHVNDILRYMNGFYIKDSETLIFDGSFGLLEMRRLSYPNDYKAQIGGI